MQPSLSKTQLLVLNGVIAGTYAALTLVASALNLAYGPVQFRFSEALTVLPFLFPGTWPGLFVGCLIANLLSPYGALDVIFGSIATLVACLWTSRMRRKALTPLPAKGKAAEHAGGCRRRGGHPPREAL